MAVPFSSIAPCHRFQREVGCTQIDQEERYSFVEFCFCSQYCHLYEAWNADYQIFEERGDCCRDILQFDNCIGM